MIGQNLNNEQKLSEIYRMTEENNDILRSLRRQQYVTNVFRGVYWLVIIASLGGVYLFVKPLIGAVTGGGSSLQETLRQFNLMREKLPEAKVLQQMMGGDTQMPEDGTVATSTPE